MNRLISSLLVCAWILALLAAVTGIMASKTYSDSVERAHASVEQLRASGGGAFAAGLHYWSSAGLIFLLVLAIGAMLWAGWYSWPKRLVWWATLIGLGAALGVQFTGNLLPLSQHDVATANIEGGIVSAAPGFGPAAKKLLLSGSQVSTSTLQFWYGMHRFLFTPLLIVVGIVTLAALRREQVKPLAVVVGVALASILLLSFSPGAPLGPAAGPDDFGSFGTEPMWYAYPPHILLVAAQKISPSAGWLGALLAPGLIGILFFALPLLSRKAEKPRLGRALVALLLIGGVIGAVLVPSAVANPFFEKGLEAGNSGREEIDVALARRGKEIFEQQPCLGCHKVGTHGEGDNGPNLQFIGEKRSDAAWLTAMLLDPPSKGFQTMPATDVKGKDLRALVEYLRSLKRPR